MALRIAQQRPTVIINADAMQMVSALRIITARPTEEEGRQAEHALYGVLPATTPTSVARWLAMVQPVIARAWEEEKLPLLVGGTGMYIGALMQGISKIPPVSDAARRTIRTLDAAARYTALQARDPIMAARLKPGDTQRILRALEVIESTGQSLAFWQQLGKEQPFPEAQFHLFCASCDRAALYARIDQRFDAMLAAGALEEVRALLAIQLPPDIPILRATGVPELTAYLNGTMDYDSAVHKAKQHSRNYAKRQLTWIRNQMPHAVTITHAEEMVIG